MNIPTPTTTSVDKHIVNPTYLTLSKSEQMLTQARKRLTVLVHANIQGHAKATLEVIAYAALSVGRLERVVALKRQECRAAANNTPVSN
jgi:hypothetical protein